MASRFKPVALFVWLLLCLTISLSMGCDYVSMTPEMQNVKSCILRHSSTPDTVKVISWRELKKVDKITAYYVEYYQMNTFGANILNRDVFFYCENEDQWVIKPGGPMKNPVDTPLFWLQLDVSIKIAAIELKEYLRNNKKPS